MTGTTAADVKRVVSQHFGLREIEMVSRRRSRGIAEARQIAMTLVYELTPLSMPNIGRQFGDRDHTTVLHAIHKIEGKLDSDAGFAEMIQTIRDKLRLECECVA